MSYWTKAQQHRASAICGFDGHAIEPDQPVYVMDWGGQVRYRCEVHAPAQAAGAHDSPVAPEPVRNLRQEVIPANPELREEFHAILAKGGGIKGHKGPRPYSEVAHLEVNRTGGDE